MEVQRATFEKALRAALALDLPYPDRDQKDLLAARKVGLLGTGAPTLAAVLALFGFEENSTLNLLFTRRTETVETHKGQMAFPGGHCEPEDGGKAVLTALRETTEEVGIAGQDIEVMGQLPALMTVTGFLIHPVVAILRRPIESISFKLDLREIAEVVWFPLQKLEEPGIYRRELHKAGGREYPIHVYQMDRYRIWGATGAMTKNLLDRLNQLNHNLKENTP